MAHFVHRVLQTFLDLAQDNVQILQPALQNRQWPTSHIRGLFDQETPGIWPVSMRVDSNLDSKILIWWIPMWFNGMLVHSCFVLADFVQEILRHLRLIVLFCYLKCFMRRIEVFMHRKVQDFFHQRDDCNSCPQGVFLHPYHPVHGHGRIMTKLSRKQGHSNAMMRCISISAKLCSTWCWHAWLQDVCMIAMVDTPASLNLIS